MARLLITEKPSSKYKTSNVNIYTQAEKLPLFILFYLSMFLLFFFFFLMEVAGGNLKGVNKPQHNYFIFVTFYEGS